MDARATRARLEWSCCARQPVAGRDLEKVVARLLPRIVRYIAVVPRQLPTTLHFAAESETEATDEDDQADDATTATTVNTEPLKADNASNGSNASTSFFRSYR